MRRVPRGARFWFAAFAVLFLSSAFVVKGAAGGVVMAVAIVAFFTGIIRALRGSDPEAVKNADRAGLSGFGG